MDPFTLLLVAGAGYLLLRGKAKPSIGAMAANMAIPPPEPFTPLPPFEPGAAAGQSLTIAPRPQVISIGTVKATLPAIHPVQAAPPPPMVPIGSIGGTVLAPPSLDSISQGDIVQTTV